MKRQLTLHSVGKNAATMTLNRKAVSCLVIGYQALDIADAPLEVGIIQQIMDNKKLAQGRRVYFSKRKQQKRKAPMTPETIDYLLRLAIQAKLEAARDLVTTGAETSKDWGEASAAVRELLDLKQR